MYDGERSKYFQRSAQQTKEAACEAIENGKGFILAAFREVDGKMMIQTETTGLNNIECDAVLRCLTDHLEVAKEMSLKKN